jgi:hypothetical protein
MGSSTSTISRFQYHVATGTTIDVGAITRDQCNLSTGTRR